MIKVSHVNPQRRDLLKKLLALGIVISSTKIAAPKVFASTISKDILSLNILKRGEHKYEMWRLYSLWRANIPDLYPDIIVQAHNETDITEALLFAKEKDLQVVCRSSGHGTAAPVLRNGGMMLDISELNGIEVNPDSKTVTVGPSVRMASLYAAISEFDLDFPHADCTSVSIGGYILGGGLGKNANIWTKGPACYALKSAEVILACGKKVFVDDKNHSDLFWALRGCGPAFFGVVVKYTLQLFDSAGAMMKSEYTFPIKDLHEVTTFFDNELHSVENRAVEVKFYLISDDNNTGDMYFKLILLAVKEKGMTSEKSVKNILVHYAEEKLIRKAIIKKEYLLLDAAKQMMTTSPSGRTHTDNIYTDDSSAFLATVEHYKKKPAKLKASMSFSHGRQTETLRLDSSYSAHGKHMVSSIMDWNDAIMDEGVYEWAIELSKILKPFGTGHYLNQIDTSIFPEKVEQSFSKSAWSRLNIVRSKYDPYNRFFTYVGLDT